MNTPALYNVRHDEINLSKIVSRIKENLDRTPKFFDERLVGAGGLIFDSMTNQLLIVKGTEKWSLPKGHQIPGEDWHQTAMREIYEETSLKFELRSVSHNRRIMKCLYYLIVLDQGHTLPLKPVDTHEITDLKWCTRSQITQLDCNKQLRFLLKNWDIITDMLFKYKNQVRYTLTSPHRLYSRFKIDDHPHDASFSIDAHEFDQMPTHKPVNEVIQEATPMSTSVHEPIQESNPILIHVPRLIQPTNVESNDKSFLSRLVPIQSSNLLQILSSNYKPMLITPASVSDSRCCFYPITHPMYVPLSSLVFVNTSSC